MTTMLTGSVATTAASNYILQNQRVVDMADKIYLLEPNAAPLYVLVSKLNKRVAINTKVEWIEDVLNPSWTTLLCSIGAASATSAESIAVTDESIFNKWDVVKIPSTGEVMLVSAISTTALKVIRNYGESTSASASGGADIVIIGSAFSEGSSATDLVTLSTQTVAKYNYLQIFRKSIQLTKTLANSELYGGADRPYQRKKKGIELMRDLERSFLYGRRAQDATATYDAGTSNRRLTSGIDYYISTNSTGAGGALTESEFEGFLRSVFRYGSSSRYLFCAPLILSVISLWAQGKLQTFPKDKTYGIAISQYLSPHGTVNLVKELMLENAGGVSSTSNYGGYAFAIELEDVTYRYLANRDVTMETDIQNPGDDFYKDQYICEVGMEFHNEQKHGKLTGVTS
jgi:hypothetical protein